MFKTNSGESWGLASEDQVWVHPRPAFATRVPDRASRSRHAQPHAKLGASLGGVRVFELGSGLPLWHAGRLLQCLGADVARVEPPDGIAVLPEERGRRGSNGLHYLLGEACELVGPNSLRHTTDLVEGLRKTRGGCIVINARRSAWQSLRV